MCLCHSAPDHVVNDAKHRAQAASGGAGRSAHAAGSPLPPSTLPCLLLRQPPLLAQRDLGAGWDVVVPAPWAATVWNALVLAAVSAVRTDRQTDVFA